MKILIAAFLAATVAAAPKNVVILGFDGLSAAGFAQANAPTFHKLRDEGAWTMHARGVMPTVSSPNWASMIMGAGPEQHGVTSNEWQPGSAEITPSCTDGNGRFPTIFGLLRKQRPSAKIAIFHEWKDFARLVEPGVPDVMENGSSAQDTIARATAYWNSHQPDLLFIHLDSIDHAGHEKGHMTPEYLAAIHDADALIATLLKGVNRKDTVVLVTADHGGVGKKHGGNSMAELEIPWIAIGASVRPGEIRTPVNTFDTAATAAAILNLRTPDCWIGRAVPEALGRR